MPADSRDAAETALAVVVSQQTRTYLQRVLDAVLAAIKSGRYDEAQPVLALGVLMNWWTDSVGEAVVDSIRESWQAAFGVTAQGVTTPRADAMAFHIAAVRDRLSRSALPEIPEEAFDQIRLSQSAAALGGWSIPEQARDISERLSWEPDKSYWQEVKANAEDEIDKILDPLGKPGTPARTYAHQHDPAVKIWQTVRAQAVDRINEDESVWQIRATRIARTEATSAWNSGSLAALAEEGVLYKEWLATEDTRTRDSHRLADGQVVPMTKPFKVGESLLMMPGDPAAPPWETINCRCTVIGADAPQAKALTAAGFDADQLRIPKGNGELSGRWMDSPLKMLDRLDDIGFLTNDEATVHLRGARNAAENFDPATEPSVSDILSDIEYAKQLEESTAGETDMTRALDKIVEDLETLDGVDWSLFDEATDIQQIAPDDIASDRIDRAREMLDDLERDMGEFPESQRFDTALAEARSTMEESQIPEASTIERLVDDLQYAAEAAYGDSNIDASTRISMYNRIQQTVNALNNVAEEANDADPEISVESQEILSLDPTNPDEWMTIIDLTQDTLSEVVNGEEDQTLLYHAMTARINAILYESGSDLHVEKQKGGWDFHDPEMTWAFYDNDGQRWGSITRRFDGSTVTNEYFNLSPSKQGMGTAAALTVGLEAWYEEQGIEQIKVHANIDVGGYTWAKMGFDVDEEEGDPTYIIRDAIDRMLSSVARYDDTQLARLWADKIREDYGIRDDAIMMSPKFLEGILQEFEMAGIEFDEDVVKDWYERADGYEGKEVATELIEEFRQNAASTAFTQAMDTLEEWASSADSADGPTMYDLATFGQDTVFQVTQEQGPTMDQISKGESGGTITMWPGKAAMLGLHWYGVKHLGGIYR